MNDTDNESSKFATRKWYVINNQNNTEYGERNENDSSIKSEIKGIKSNLCDYSDAYILVTEDTKVAFKNYATFSRCVTHINDEAFKNYATFSRCVTHINDEHIDSAENLDIIMNR